MELSITIREKTYKVTAPDVWVHAGIDELLNEFKGLLVAAGYHPESVDRCIYTDSQWFSDDTYEKNNVELHKSDVDDS